MKYVNEYLPYVIIIIVVILIRAFIITPVRVQGPSMNNTLENGDILLLYKLGKLNRNDIAVLKDVSDDEAIIKRVIGLPGETIEIVDGVIYINDKELEDKHSIGDTRSYNRITLADDEYFLLGDNRTVSKDSRYFGPVKASNIKGKVIFRLYPFKKIGTIK